VIDVKGGFAYKFDVINQNGDTVDSWEARNIVPNEGLDYITSVALLGGAQSTTWYFAPYENDYTPIAADVAATFPGAGVALECTAYVSATRPALTLVKTAAGVVDNTAAKADLEFNATKTVRGGFIVSTSAKGATSGTLLSAVKFPVAKLLETGFILRITAGMTITSA
jgi:threonine dehydrogenase-like Zn-dependent dehydrogenase